MILKHIPFKMNLHPVTVVALAFIALSCFNERSYGLTAKFIPEFKKAETNYKWFKIDKNLKPEDQNEEGPGPIMYNPRFQDLQQQQQAGGLMENENIPLPLALSMLHEKRGMFDLGTGRRYSGFQAMRGNLGLAFASPGSHGK